MNRPKAKILGHSARKPRSRLRAHRILESEFDIENTIGPCRCTEIPIRMFQRYRDYRHPTAI